MAISSHHQHNSSFSSSSSSSSSSFPSPSLLDALYCEEEELWEDEEGDGVQRESMDDIINNNNVGLVLFNNKVSSETATAQKYPSSSLLPHLLLLEQDLFYEDAELLSLFSKEQQTHPIQELSSGCCCFSGVSSSSALSMVRREAVEWMLKVNSYYGFSALTTILSVNYLDRFLSRSPQFQRHPDGNNYNSKPWLIQLVAVTCLSLAAKVEETQVPLLLDLQVEGTKYVFEAKTIQKMELLVLSTLDWKMNAVTPMSFIDYIIRRLGLKTTTHPHWDFLRRCERLLLSIVADSRFVRYLPSVLGTATMMHVIDQIEPSNTPDYHNRLLAVLSLSLEKVKDCYEMMMVQVSGMSSSSYYGAGGQIESGCYCANPTIMTVNPNPRKRNRGGGYAYAYAYGYGYNDELAPSSPSGVIDASNYLGSDDSSNESWRSLSTSPPSSLTSYDSSSSSSSSSLIMSSSPNGRFSKKSRVREQYMPLSISSSSTSSLLGRRVFLADAFAAVSPH